MCAVSGATSVSGVCLLALYMCCDSFTSSWQAALFARHGALRPLQMLVAVNLCSSALTAAAMLRRPTAAALQLLQVSPHCYTIRPDKLVSRVDLDHLTKIDQSNVCYNIYYYFYLLQPSAIQAFYSRVDPNPFRKLDL